MRSKKCPENEFIRYVYVASRTQEFRRAICSKKCPEVVLSRPDLRICMRDFLYSTGFQRYDVYGREMCPYRLEEYVWRRVRNDERLLWEFVAKSIAYNCAQE